MKLLQNYPVLQRYITSSVSTFLATFFLSVSIQISNGTGIQLTGAFLLSMLMIAVRAASKGVVESLAGRHADVQ